MNSVFKLTMLCSLLIHLTVYVGLMVNFEDILSTPPEANKTMEFVLEPPIPEPIPEPLLQQPNNEQPKPLEEQQDKPPSARHMEDDINKANTSDGLAESGGRQTPKPKGQKEQEINDSEALAKANSANVINSSLSSLLQQAIDDAQEDSAYESQDKNKVGQQLEELDEQALDDHLVASPLDKLEEEKARWRNMVLKRISEQITFVWVKPDGTHKSDSGVIKLDIDAQGYLKGAWVHLPSGDRTLDASILRAIRSVWRFQIPESDRLNRYYRHLEFHYRGGKQSG
jgi:hypothetical protein